MPHRNAKPGRSHEPTSLWLLACHDFRQPAQTLDLLAGSLAGAETEADRQRYAASLAQVASSLRDMVAGLTLVARAEAASAPAASRTVGIQDVVDALAPELGPLLPRVEAGSLAGAAVADTAVLTAAVRGAVLYALKLADDGPIRLASSVTGQRVHISIEFPGHHPPGVRQDMAFVELAPATPEDRPLVGLAPALIERILLLSGGTIALEKIQDGQARVVITLPAAARS